MAKGKGEVKKIGFWKWSEMILPKIASRGIFFALIMTFFYYLMFGSEFFNFNYYLIEAFFLFGFWTLSMWIVLWFVYKRKMNKATKSKV